MIKSSLHIAATLLLLLVSAQAHLRSPPQQQKERELGNIPPQHAGDDGEPYYDPQPFSFDAPFGDNMVLQRADPDDSSSRRAAIYGFLGPDCQAVQVDLYEAVPTEPFFHIIHSSSVGINVTHQPFPTEDTPDGVWGPRPCDEDSCPNPYARYHSVERRAFNPWNTALPTWKAWLPPQDAGGNYTVKATCTEGTNESLDDDDLPSEFITNITYGDVWYCSGQSNMQMELRYTFQRYEVAHEILQGKYSNLRIMAGKSEHKVYGLDNYASAWNYAKYGSKDGTNPWMPAIQALNVIDGHNGTIIAHDSPWFDVGASCWYFGQHLVNKMEKDGKDVPIGLINTAIGGRTVQEFSNNATIGRCHNRSRAEAREDHLDNLWFEGQLYAQQVLPFADMTIKGWIWYQGENNMWEVKGNSKHNIGYGCELKNMIQAWREVWSETPDTTSPTAPFGIVTITSRGDEGGPDLGAMRHAQTLNYGVLPPPHVDIADQDFVGLQNTFVVQAYDLDDEWDGDLSPCLQSKCCTAKIDVGDDYLYDPEVCSNETLYKACNSPVGACAQIIETQTVMGAIHPRSKMQLGMRIASAAYNFIYGGKLAYTGPTLQGCSVKDHQSEILEIRFNATMLRGESLAEPVIPPTKILPPYGRSSGGSQLYVQIEESKFCVEEFIVHDGHLRRAATYTCPTWAGGTEETATKPQNRPYDEGWIQVPFHLKPGTNNTILATLKGHLPEGATPTAVRFAWNFVFCCDHTDPDMFITKSCTENCPLYTTESRMPANPFVAKIVDGQCECIAPQVCTDNDDELSGVH